MKGKMEMEVKWKWRGKEADQGQKLGLFHSPVIKKDSPKDTNVGDKDCVNPSFLSPAYEIPFL